jgi:hypothetical protein
MNTHFGQARVQRLAQKLLRVHFPSDIHERAAELGVALPPGPKRRSRLARIAERGVLFVHIPKNGGTSIGQRFTALISAITQSAIIRSRRGA